MNTPDQPNKPSINVMIPTLNEADHIAEVVANAQQLGSVFVLDSLSTDGTQELAKRAGATVVEHPFTSYSAQKNWGLNNLPFTGEWVFILDADERLTPKLVREIREVIARDPGVNGYYVNRMMIFMGQAIRHGGFHPSWNLRLFRRGHAHYEDRAVHEHMVCDRPTAFLRFYMLHVRRETVSQFLAKHIRYADMESGEWFNERRGRGGNAHTWALFKDSLFVHQWVRRRIWPLLPMRPLGRFIYMYLFRLGFLDGLAGWHLAWLMACYEHMIDILYREKVALENGRP